MIKQIDLDSWDLLEDQLQKASLEGYSHIVLTNNNIKIYKNMMAHVQLEPCTIVPDYTIHQQYLNDCRYFGKKTLLLMTGLKISIITQISSFISKLPSRY